MFIIFFFLATPTLILFVNNEEISQNETITFEYGQQYVVICSAINSDPDVSLSIYDTTNGYSLDYNNNIRIQGDQ